MLVSCGALDRLGLEAQLSATSCGKIVFVPWPISVWASARGRSVLGQLDRGDAGDVHLARSGEPGAVPAHRHPDPGASRAPD